MNNGDGESAAIDISMLLSGEEWGVYSVAERDPQCAIVIRKYCAEYGE
jgi:hypothetical protein